MSNFSCSFFLLTVTSLPFSGYCLGLSLDYNKITVFQSSGNTATRNNSSQPEKIKEEQNQNIIILPRQFSVSTGPTQRIYDLDLSTLTIINHKNKSFQVFSSEFIALSKLKEIDQLKNRAIKSKEKGAANQINSFELSHYFNINLAEDKLNKKNKKIVERASALDRIFFYKNNIIASFTISPQIIPSELQYSYSQYILHEQLLHPWISERLLSYHRIPSRLSHKHKIVLNEDISFVLKKITELNYSEIKIPENYYKAQEKEVEKPLEF